MRNNTAMMVAPPPPGAAAAVSTTHAVRATAVTNSVNIISCENPNSRTYHQIPLKDEPKRPSPVKANGMIPLTEAEIMCTLTRSYNQVLPSNMGNPKGDFVYTVCQIRIETFPMITVMNTGMTTNCNESYDHQNSGDGDDENGRNKEPEPLLEMVQRKEPFDVPSKKRPYDAEIAGITGTQTGTNKTKQVKTVTTADEPMEQPQHHRIVSPQEPLQRRTSGRRVKSKAPYIGSPSRSSSSSTTNTQKRSSSSKAGTQKHRSLSWKRRPSVTTATAISTNKSSSSSSSNNNSPTTKDQNDMKCIEQIQMWCHGILGMDVRLGIRFINQELRLQFPMLATVSSSLSSALTSITTTTTDGRITNNVHPTAQPQQYRYLHNSTLAIPYLASAHRSAQFQRSVDTSSPPQYQHRAYANRSCIAVSSLHYNGIGKLFGFQFNDIFVHPNRADQTMNEKTKIMNNASTSAWSFMTESQLYQALNNLYQHGSYTFFVVRKQPRKEQPPARLILPPSRTTNSGPYKNAYRPTHTLLQRMPAIPKQPPTIDHKAALPKLAPKMPLSITTTRASTTTDSKKASTKYTIGTSVVNNVPSETTTISRKLTATTAPMVPLKVPNINDNRIAAAAASTLGAPKQLQYPPDARPSDTSIGVSTNQITVEQKLPNADLHCFNENTHIAGTTLYVGPTIATIAVPQAYAAVQRQPPSCVASAQLSNTKSSTFPFARGLTFPVTYVKDIKSLIVIPERATANAVVPAPSPGMDVKPSDIMPASKNASSNKADAISRTEATITDVQKLLVIPDRANVSSKYLEIAPKPPEYIANQKPVVTPKKLPAVLFNHPTNDDSIPRRAAVTDSIPKTEVQRMDATRCHSIDSAQSYNNTEEQDDDKTDGPRPTFQDMNPSLRNVPSTPTSFSTTKENNPSPAPSSAFAKKTDFVSERPLAFIPSDAIFKHEINLYYDVILGRPASSVQRGKTKGFSPESLNYKRDPNKIFDGESSTASDVAVFDATLHDWWEKYELASHVDKIHVAKFCIEDMVSRGCRFLQKVDDGTRNGHYIKLSPGFEPIRRKVLRALRQVVLQRIEKFTAEEHSQHKLMVSEQRAYIKSQDYKRRFWPNVGHKHLNSSDSMTTPSLEANLTATTSATTTSELLPSPPLEAILSPVILGALEPSEQDPNVD